MNKTEDRAPKTEYAWFLQHPFLPKFIGINDVAQWSLVDSTEEALKFSDKESAVAFNSNWLLQYRNSKAWLVMRYAYVPHHQRVPQTKNG